MTRSTQLNELFLCELREAHPHSMNWRGVAAGCGIIDRVFSIELFDVAAVACNLDEIR